MQKRKKPNYMMKQLLSSCNYLSGFDPKSQLPILKNAFRKKSRHSAGGSLATPPR
jgi:hypothetical protein